MVVGLVASLIVATQPLLEQIRHVCPGVDDSCGRSMMAFESQFGWALQVLYLSFLVIPVLSGLFIGAPLLAREFEQGTDQLVWTQGITRIRWLLVKLAVLGAVTAIIAGILAFAGQLGSSSRPPMSYNQWFAFDNQGPEFVAYAFFSFALGVAAGAAIGRSVPAMAVVIVGFVAVRAAIGLVARRSFLPPVESEVSGAVFKGGNQAWMLGSQYPADTQGHAMSWDHFQQIVTACSNPAAGPKGSLAQMELCWHDHGVTLFQSIQPADRFPLFQGIESVIFLIAAIALLWLAVWLVGRRA
jgi:hypothetical protein